MPGSDQHRQDALRPDHGLTAEEDLPSDRGAPWRGQRGTGAEVCRAFPGDASWATNLPAGFTRHPSLSSGASDEVVSPGFREPVARSTLADANDYSLERWAALSPHATDGLLPIDHNPLENVGRPIALGRITGPSRHRSTPANGQPRFELCSARRHSTRRFGRVVPPRAGETTAQPQQRDRFAGVSARGTHTSGREVSQ